ncbi:MAG TPA: hypothetical protein VF120_09935, partial [Ktedonobacterales bacterium]
MNEQAPSKRPKRREKPSPEQMTRPRRDRAHLTDRERTADDATPISAEARAEVAAFAATQPYPLDPFQVEAAEHLAEGRSVLVAAP